MLSTFIKLPFVIKIFGFFFFSFFCKWRNKTGSPTVALHIGDLFKHVCLCFSLFKCLPLDAIDWPVVHICVFS